MTPITYGLAAMIASLLIFCAICYCYAKKCAKPQAENYEHGASGHMIHPAFKWKSEKEKELKEICVPFKFTLDKLDFDE